MAVLQLVVREYVCETSLARTNTCRCGKVYGRHTNSLDVSTKVCGVCRGRLVALGRFNPDGTPAAARAPTPYGQFVKVRRSL